MSSTSSLSRPTKLSFRTLVIGFPAKERLLRWCIECQAELGGAGSSLWLRSSCRTSDRLAKVLEGTNVNCRKESYC